MRLEQHFHNMKMMAATTTAPPTAIPAIAPAPSCTPDVLDELPEGLFDEEGDRLLADGDTELPPPGVDPPDPVITDVLAVVVAPVPVVPTVVLAPKAVAPTWLAYLITSYQHPACY